MQEAVIFDIDGTIANNDERQKILKDNVHNWQNFFNEMGNDTVNKAISEIYDIIKKTKKYKMLIVTGRPETYRKITEQWLIWNRIEYDNLYMRSENDCRSDVDVKREILQKIREQYDVSFVFDDRRSVVQMWREEGLVCFQCFDHDY